MKNKAKKPQLPNNSRFITEKFIPFLQKAFAITLAITLFLAFVLLGMDMQKTFANIQKNDRERTELLKEYNYWQNITKMSPTYRDGYFNLAVISYRLGNYENALSFTEKTLTIDPNFEPAQKMEKLLTK